MHWALPCSDHIDPAWRFAIVSLRRGPQIAPKKAARSAALGEQWRRQLRWELGCAGVSVLANRAQPAGGGIWSQHPTLHCALATMLGEPQIAFCDRVPRGLIVARFKDIALGSVAPAARGTCSGSSNVASASTG
eukprot:1097219-Amphidinium_carterae.1